MASFESLLPWLVLLFGVISVCMYCLPTQYGSIVGREHSANRVQVLVLGDIGRSPRMQYHALSLAKLRINVDLIGYHQSDIHPDILANSSSIRIHALTPIPDFLKIRGSGLFVIYGPLKVLFQVWATWLALGYSTRPARYMLVQNPPSIPTLLIAKCLCFLRHTHLVVDWHNFGYSILALRLGSAHPLVRISRLYEYILARSADAHFCVTNAMARVLEQDYQIRANVRILHDRPASCFQPLAETQRLAFLDKLPYLLCTEQAHPLEEYQRLLRDVKLGKSRILVSSTSWTPDEDFTILLDALIQYSDLAITTHPELPEIFAIITGKGPQKDDFCSRIKHLKSKGRLEMVSIETAFLSMDDYANLLGSADLGVSLHTSSSGVDLPMKVVDMFGAGLPVVGWGNYEAWPELVREGVNGHSFSDAAGLQEWLVKLFGGDQNLLKKLKEGALDEGKKRWDEEWNRVAGPVFTSKLLA